RPAGLLACLPCRPQAGMGIRMAEPDGRRVACDPGKPAVAGRSPSVCARAFGCRRTAGHHGRHPDHRNGCRRAVRHGRAGGQKALGPDRRVTARPPPEASATPATVGVRLADPGMAGDFPTAAMELTILLVVSDLERSRAFYEETLGAELYRDYGGTSAVLRFLGTWLLLVTGGGPTADKPDVTFAPPADPDTVSHEITIRVPDCRAAYQTLLSRGARFLTPPVEYEWEIRCFFRDPDGHLLEISEARSAQ